MSDSKLAEAVSLTSNDGVNPPLARMEGGGVTTKMDDNPVRKAKRLQSGPTRTHRLATLSVAATLLAACQKDEWEGFVYPSRNDLTEHVSVGVFESLDACRGAVRAIMEQNGWQETGDYECGLNCKTFLDGSTLKICEETSR